MFVDRKRHQKQCGYLEELGGLYGKSEELYPPFGIVDADAGNQNIDEAEHRNYRNEYGQCGNCFFTREFLHQVKNDPSRGKKKKLLEYHHIFGAVLLK